MRCETMQCLAIDSTPIVLRKADVSAIAGVPSKNGGGTAVWLRGGFRLHVKDKFLDVAGRLDWPAMVAHENALSASKAVA